MSHPHLFLGLSNEKYKKNDITWNLNYGVRVKFKNVLPINKFEENIYEELSDKEVIVFYYII